MKSCIVFALFVAAAVALPVSNSKDTVVESFKNENIGVDGYNYGYVLSDGTKAQEEGQLKNVGSENEAISVRGQFSYVYDGVTYTVTYIADENGFQPQGAHLPTSP